MQKVQAMLKMFKNKKRVMEIYTKAVAEHKAFLIGQKKSMMLQCKVENLDDSFIVTTQGEIIDLVESMEKDLADVAKKMDAIGQVMNLTAELEPTEEVKNEEVKPEKTGCPCGSKHCGSIASQEEADAEKESIMDGLTEFLRAKGIQGEIQIVSGEDFMKRSSKNEEEG